MRHLQELLGRNDLTGMFGQIFQVSFEVEAIVERDMNELYKLSPPRGRLLLAQTKDQIAGLGGLRESAQDIGEIKRMYVRPNFRGRGIGRMLLEALIEQARQIGYGKIRLDVGPYATSAQKLYRAAGFDR